MVLHAVTFLILARRALARHVVAHTQKFQCSPRRSVVHTDQCLCFYFDGVCCHGALKIKHVLIFTANARRACPPGCSPHTLARFVRFWHGVLERVVYGQL